MVELIGVELTWNPVSRIANMAPAYCSHVLVVICLQFYQLGVNELPWHSKTSIVKFKKSYFYNGRPIGERVAIGLD